MISMSCSFLILHLGYLFYSRVVENTFGPDGRTTPAFAMEDG